MARLRRRRPQDDQHRSAQQTHFQGARHDRFSPGTGCVHEEPEGLRCHEPSRRTRTRQPKAPNPQNPEIPILLTRWCPRSVEPWWGIRRRMGDVFRFHPLISIPSWHPRPAHSMDDLARFCCQNPDCTLYGRRDAGNLSVCGRSASTSRSACSTATPARPASPSARARRCSAAICPRRRPSPSSSTSTRAAASARPDDSSASIATPSSDWPAPPDSTPTTLTTSSWLFPPRTREVQFDEKWSFVAKKQKNCDPTDPADDHKGDWWDHVAYDPEHRLVLAVVPGARSIENAEEVVAEAKDRTDGASPRLDDQRRVPGLRDGDRGGVRRAGRAEPPAGPGRRPVLPERRLPEGLTYATVHKEREKDRVVAVERRLVFGTEAAWRRPWRRRR